MSRIRSDVLVNKTITQNYTQQVYLGYNTTLKKCGGLGAPFSVGSSTFTDKYHYRSMTDELVPKFYTRQKRGELFFNNMSKTETILERNSGVFTWDTYDIDAYGCRKNGGVRTSLMAFTSSPLTYGNAYIPQLPVDLASEKNRLTIEAEAKAYVNDIVLLATLGEFKETVGSIGIALLEVAKILKAFKSKRFLSYLSKKKAKDVANIYMYYRYALRPLYYDIVGAIKAFNSLKDVETIKRQTYRSFSKYRVQSDNQIIVANTSTDYWVQRCVQTREVQIRSGCLADIHVSWDTILGLDRIVSSAWELVPLSFIVDWFLNIGQIIASCEPTAKRRLLGNWVVVYDALTTLGFYSQIGVKAPRQGSITTDAQLIRYNYTKIRECNLNPNFDISLNVKLDVLKILDLGIILKNLSGFKFA